MQPHHIFQGYLHQNYDDKISDVVLDSNQKAFNYFLGVNPISFSYVSGYGENSVKNIFSAIYSKDVPLEPYKCPSGYVTEGANSNNNPHLSKYIGKCYMDSDAEYTTNENTIYGNAAMILLTASMIARTERSSVKGDVNADGEFNIADAILLQKWLINPNEIKLPNWKNADLCEDNMLDVVDLCIMKNSFLGK